MTDPDDPIASKLNSRPKYVVSTTMERADREPTRIIRGDLAEEIPALQERTDGEVQVHGSGRLAHTLLEHDLIDTLHVLTHPAARACGSSRRARCPRRSGTRTPAPPAAA